MISMKETTKISTSNAAVDIAKFVFSILIAMLHAGVDLGPFSPIYRLAVPCFFLLSAYYLFAKLSKTDEESQQKRILKNFVLRNLKLLLFWTVVQFPATARSWHWGEPALMMDLLTFMRGLLFGSVFTASWYINATIIGCCAIYWLSRTMSDRTLLIMGGLAYLGCLAFSNYYGLVKWCLPLRYALTAFATVFNSFVTGFPAGILWIVIGKLVAQRRLQFCKFHLWLFLGGVAALFAEKWVINRLGIALRDDCYLFLIPACYGLTRCLLAAKWSWCSSVRFRSMSTIIYVTHGSGLALAQIWCDSALMAVGCVLLLAGLLSALIFTLEKSKPFGWMKYIY